MKNFQPQINMFQVKEERTIKSSKIALKNITNFPFNFSYKPLSISTHRYLQKYIYKYLLLKHSLLLCFADLQFMKSSFCSSADY